jgi:nucleoside-diphosphate-sugar epimerase
MDHRVSAGTAGRALVAGGAGFIGSHLCRALLDRGYEVLCVDSLLTGHERNLHACWNEAGFSFLRHDVTHPLDAAALARARRGEGPLALVFHLASPASVVDYLRLPLETMLVNSQGTHELLELARRCGARFLFASTSEVYGDPLVHPQAEDYWGHVNPNGVRSVYDESKRFGEALVMHYYRAQGLDARIVRIFNTYGPHSRPGDGRVVPNLLTQALRGEPLTIYGDGSQTRSFCYVSDLVRGIMLAMLTAGTTGDVFNLGNPDEYSINLFADVIERLFGTGAGRDYRPLPVDDPTRRRPDISKARRILGWEPHVGLENGLRRTAAWFAALVNQAAPSAHDRKVMADG